MKSYRSSVLQKLLESGGETQVVAFKADIAQICLAPIYSWKDTRLSGEQARLSAEFPLSDLRPCLTGSWRGQVQLKRKWRGFSKVWDSDLENALKELGFTVRKPMQKDGHFVFATYIGIGDGWPITLEQFCLIHEANNLHLQSKLKDFATYCGEGTWLKSQWETNFNAWCGVEGSNP